LLNTFLRLSGVANIGGTVGGAVGIILAMALNKKKEVKKEEPLKKGVLFRRINTDLSYAF